METGALTGYFDVAQVVLYVFWIFFAGLVYYLRREDKREGYPLERERPGPGRRVRIQGFPALPRPKLFRLGHGQGTVAAPRASNEPSIHSEPSAPWPGSPLQPLGNPMLSGVGPSAYALRSERPDLTIDGHPRIVPMRVATDFSVESRDPDPRGRTAVGADGETGGVIQDIWVDRSEPQARYLEVETAPAGRRVLVPIPLVTINRLARRVTVRSVLGRQFADAPSLASPDQVSLREEDQASAYFASGNLFATTKRSEPLL